MAPDCGLDMKFSARGVRLMDVIYAAPANESNWSPRSRNVEISVHQILWDKKPKL
jgi:hypothetical protein